MLGRQPRSQADIWDDLTPGSLKATRRQARRFAQQRQADGVAIIGRELRQVADAQGHRADVIGRLMRFQPCADMGSWAIRWRNFSHSGRGNIIRHPCGWRVRVSWPEAVAKRTSRCRVGTDSRPFASRLSDDAP